MIGGIQSRIHKYLVVWALCVRDTQAPLDGIQCWTSFNMILFSVVTGAIEAQRRLSWLTLIGQSAVLCRQTRVWFFVSLAALHPSG